MKAIEITNTPDTLIWNVELQTTRLLEICSMLAELSEVEVVLPPGIDLLSPCCSGLELLRDGDLPNLFVNSAISGNPNHVYEYEIPVSKNQVEAKVRNVQYMWEALHRNSIRNSENYKPIHPC